MSQDTDPNTTATPDSAPVDTAAAKPKPSVRSTTARTAIRHTAKRPSPSTQTESNRPYDADYRSGRRVWPD